MTIWKRISFDSDMGLEPMEPEQAPDAAIEGDDTMELETQAAPPAEEEIDLDDEIAFDDEDIEATLDLDSDVMDQKLEDDSQVETIDMDSMGDDLGDLELEAPELGLSEDQEAEDQEDEAALLDDESTLLEDVIDMDDLALSDDDTLSDDDDTLPDEPSDGFMDPESTMVIEPREDVPDTQSGAVDVSGFGVKSADRKQPSDDMQLDLEDLQLQDDDEGDEGEDTEMPSLDLDDLELDSDTGLDDLGLGLEEVQADDEELQLELDDLSEDDTTQKK